MTAREALSSSMSRVPLAGALLAMALGAAPAAAFPHVVAPGETLAQIAERTYGKVEHEQLLVVANGLDQGAGAATVAGMRLEIPGGRAPAHRRRRHVVGAREELLGDADRSDVLSIANGSMPWLPCADGQEMCRAVQPALVTREGDSILTVAYRFLGERDKAWMLDRYNRLKGKALTHGQVLLVPLVDLPLTDAGKAEAAAAGALVRAEGAGRARDAQRKIDAELPQLAADLRGGRWVEAVARGNRLLGLGDLTKPQLAATERALTEAYVALEATGLAEPACHAWRDADPAAALTPSSCRRRSSVRARARRPRHDALQPHRRAGQRAAPAARQDDRRALRGRGPARRRRDRHGLRGDAPRGRRARRAQGHPSPPRRRSPGPGARRARGGDPDAPRGRAPHGFLDTVREDDRLILVLERVEGRSLERALTEDGPMDCGRAVEITLHICARWCSARRRRRPPRSQAR